MVDLWLDGLEKKEALNKTDVMVSASFLFPQIVMEKREVSLTEDEIDNLKNMSLDEQTDWIWDKMTELEQSCTEGKKWVSSAIDAGYCGFRFLH